MKGNWPAVALSSEYDFDRIAAYLYQEKRNPREEGAAMAAVSREYEKRWIHKDGSYMPLHYSLRALSASPGLKSKRGEIESVLRTVSGFLIKTARKQTDDSIVHCDQECPHGDRFGVAAERKACTDAQASSRMRW